MASRMEAREAAQQLRAEVATEAATMRARSEGVGRTLAEVQGAADRATAQVQRSGQEIDTARGRVHALVGEDADLAKELDSIAGTQAELRARFETEQGQLKAEREQLRAREEKLRGLRESCITAGENRGAIERTLVEIRSEIGRIREQLDERHALNVAALLDRVERVGHVVLEADAQAKANVVEHGEAQLALLEDLRIVRSMLEDEEIVATWLGHLEESRKVLAAIGEVNLVAVEEYQELRERHQVMGAQQDDLETSMRVIRNTIAQLNKTCRERFRDTFDRVNGYFEESYPRLVGGGRAELVLTDEEDLLTTGVEIVVQPPGKKLQVLSLLSGGEMAMVAIALIFSLFRVKPSPFCLLDEVDAPLDEGNGARFNNMLREMSKRSQFIIITHNKKTMECADTLYGVTMPTSGVSRLVSVHLDG
jgi:chromosome segregation protein